MVAIGIVAALGGYTLAYYGYDIITGGNDSLWSLFWPGAYKVTARDGQNPAGKNKGNTVSTTPSSGSNTVAK